MRPIHAAHLDKTRPVLILTREVVRPYLSRVTVAPITSTIRGLSTEVPVGSANGLDQDGVVSCDNIITVPASATNPAAEAQIDPAGWVDFGQGPVPRQLPIPSLNALGKIRLLDPTDHALSILASRLRPALDRDGRWIDKLQALLGQRPDLIVDSLTRTKFTTRITDLSHIQPTTWSAHTTGVPPPDRTHVYAACCDLKASSNSLGDT